MSPLLQEFIIPESLAVVRVEIDLYLQSLDITDLFIFISLQLPLLYQCGVRNSNNLLKKFSW